MATTLHLINVWIQTDSTNTITLLRGESISWEAKLLVQTINTLLPQFQMVQCSHVCRESNKLADILGKIHHVEPYKELKFEDFSGESK